MRPFKFLMGSILLVGSIGLCYAQEPNTCEVKARAEVESSATATGTGSVAVITEEAAQPVKYVFYEADTGKLVSNDFNKSKVVDLRKGSYYCIVIDNRGCTKKIQFQIQ